ncbi:MAG: hypothetical protein Unbinned3992contig1000_57 [Prokaryotic dsDNA virus sp.]|nr:MAG: hypothetical protein Unbinned3992contig1000_57 [Prokaryotic dsDNA virus sp.]|tara:strand:- start:20258 stop:20704 length:447 start_codon:yes stop_codon:yes gene_type:complete
MATGNGAVTRDETRTALLNGYVRKTRTYTTDEGITIEVRQPTVGQRSRMLAAGGMSSKSTELTNIGAMQVAAVIECTYMPGTGKKLFEWTDEEVIQQLPTSSWFDDVAGIAMEMMNAEPSEAAEALPKKEIDSTSSTSPKSSGAPLSG